VIEEAADEADGYEIPDFINADRETSKLDEFKDSAKQAVTSSIETVKEAAGKAMNNPEVAEKVNAVKDGIGKAVETAKVQASRITENPEVQKVAAAAQENFKKAADAVSAGTQAAVKKIDETLSKPEVQEKIADVRTKAAGLFNAAKNSVFGLIAKIGKKEAEADEAEIQAETEEEENVQNLTDTDQPE